MLSRYDGLLESLINPQVLLSPLATKEAELSSRIEGTVATANEVYQKEAGREFGSQKEADINEVINYRSALRLASRQIRTRPISLYLIRQLHEALMQDVRGDQFQGGRFRETQNWIGPTGCTIEEATYVPPAPLHLTDHLDQLEQYMTSDETSPDPIVRTALIHAQFELIHPFDDGNGRIGRLLVPLYLTKVGSLAQPSFYISGYFEANRDEYVQRLAAISNDGDWRGWIRFFLEATIEQAKSNLRLVRAMRKLYEDKKEEFTWLLRSEQAIPLLDFLFKRPVFRSPMVYQELEIKRERAASYLRTLVEHDILKQVVPAAGRRGAILSFDSLMSIADQQ
jgi:Fic family protein